MTDADGNVTAETKPLVQHAQDIIKATLEHSAPGAGEQFEERVHAEAHQQAAADSHPIVENLKRSGVKMQDNPRLTAPTPNSSPNRNQIERMD